MNDDEELLRLVKENNTLLKMILQYVSQNNFMNDIVANVIGNRLTQNNNYQNSW